MRLLERRYFNINNDNLTVIPFVIVLLIVYTYAVTDWKACMWFYVSFFFFFSFCFLSIAKVCRRGLRNCLGTTSSHGVGQAGIWLGTAASWTLFHQFLLFMFLDTSFDSGGELMRGLLATDGKAVQPFPLFLK